MQLHLFPSCLGLVLAAFVVLSPLQMPEATFYTASSSNWTTLLGSLQAGDTLYFPAGTYDLTSSPGSCNYLGPTFSGTLNSPIIIYGDGMGQSIITCDGTNQNLLDISGTGNFALYNLSFIGGSEGIRLETSMSNVLIDGVQITNTDGTGFTANIAGNTYSNITLRRMDISNTGVSTGECFYLGYESDGAQFFNSVVELNYCHNTTLAQGGSIGSGIQVKSGSYNNIIRDNVMYLLHGPGVLAYDDYGRGINVIQGNVVFPNKDNGIQVTAGARIVNNIIIGAGFYGISLSDNDPSSLPFHELYVLYNTVWNSTDGDLWLYTSYTGADFAFVNNAFLSSTAAFTSSSPQGGNASWGSNAYVTGPLPSGVGSWGGFQVTTAAVADVSNFNFYPSGPNSPLVGAGNVSYPSPIITFDFNDDARSATAPTVGAYEYSQSTNPGWTLAHGFKEFPENNQGANNAGGGVGNGGGGVGNGGGSNASTLAQLPVLLLVGLMAALLAILAI